MQVLANCRYFSESPFKSGPRFPAINPKSIEQKFVARFAGARTKIETAQFTGISRLDTVLGALHLTLIEATVPIRGSWNTSEVALRVGREDSAAGTAIAAWNGAGKDMQ
ncbi:hypothetical protein C5L14_24015 [Labrys okinawensis]|uniref:Uncharacterized protein n=1 Tax=Labrys okinawensis TaxID=346911 RepID=A0A2S9Q6T7_9HYPH|nr:hypothetical protein C5L14_24015 [Labrys okinawensis]